MDHFDWIFYVNFYSDLRAANINSEEKALEHYRSHGERENRKPFFDVGKYLKLNDKWGDALYNMISRNEMSLFSVTPEMIRHVIQDGHMEPTYQVLEIECGIACISLPIIKRLTNGKYYGVDPSKSRIEWCQRQIIPACSSRNVQFQWLPDSNSLSLPNIDNDQLDIVYSFCSFLTLPSTSIEAYLKEIHRILKPGGQVILSIFGWNQTPLITKRSRNIKTCVIKKNNQTSLANSYDERAIVHQDQQIYHLLEKMHLEVTDIIFGAWSDTSQSTIYHDMITAIKIK